MAAENQEWIVKVFFNNGSELVIRANKNPNTEWWVKDGVLAGFDYCGNGFCIPLASILYVTIIPADEYE